MHETWMRGITQPSTTPTTRIFTSVLFPVGINLSENLNAVGDSPILLSPIDHLGW